MDHTVIEQTDRYNSSFSRQQSATQMLDDLLDGQMPGCYDSFKICFSSRRDVFTVLQGRCTLPDANLSLRWRHTCFVMSPLHINSPGIHMYMRMVKELRHRQLQIPTGSGGGSLKENLGDMHGEISRNRLMTQGEFMGRTPPGRASERIATIVKQ